MDAATQFLTPGTAVLAITVVVLTFFVRRIAETAFPVLRRNAEDHQPEPNYLTVWARWWNKVILYIIPVAVGVGLAYTKVDYLFQVEGLEANARPFFGGVVGWLSSFLYKIFRQMIQKKTGLDIQPTDSTIPGAP